MLVSNSKAPIIWKVIAKQSMKRAAHMQPRATGMVKSLDWVVLASAHLSLGVCQREPDRMPCIWQTLEKKNNPWGVSENRGP